MTVSDVHTPVEISLAKIMQRLRMQISKHNPPKASLLQRILDTLCQKNSPVLSCTKVLLSNLPVFLSLLSEYDPDVYGSIFSLVLRILRRMCRIGGAAPEGRAASAAATHRIDDNKTKGKGQLAANELNDDNGYSLKGVRELLLNAGLVEVVTSAVLRSHNHSVHTEAVSFISDIAMDASACKSIIPDAFLRLVSCPRRACKLTAITMLASIYTDSASRLLLLQATTPAESRVWVMKSLPHLWHMLIDSKDGRLQAGAAEALAWLFTTLSNTEVGTSIAYGLGNMMMMGSDNEGRNVLTRLKYIIPDSDMQGEVPTTIPAKGVSNVKIDGGIKVQAQTPKGTSKRKTEQKRVSSKNIATASAGVGVLICTFVATRLVEKARAGSTPTVTLLTPLRENGLHMVLHLCLLRNEILLQQDQARLDLLEDSYLLGDSLDPAALFDALVVQRGIVRELIGVRSAVLRLLHFWLEEDEEVAWMVQMFLQRSELRTKKCSADIGEENPQAADMVEEIIAVLQHPTLAATLTAELEKILQLGMRRGAMKRMLEDASSTAISDEYSTGDVSSYEPVSTFHTFHIGSADITPCTAGAKSAVHAQITGSTTGTMGYLLLKKMFEKHGITPLPTIADMNSPTPTPAQVSPRDGKSLLRALGPGTHNGETVGSGAGAPLDEFPNAISDQEMNRILKRMGRQLTKPKVTAAASKRNTQQTQKKGKPWIPKSEPVPQQTVVIEGDQPTSKQPHAPPSESKPSAMRARPRPGATLTSAENSLTKRVRAPLPSYMQGYSLATLQALAEGQTSVLRFDKGVAVNEAANMTTLLSPDPLMKSGKVNSPTTVSILNTGDCIIPDRLEGQMLDMYLQEMHERIPREQAPIPKMSDVLQYSTLGNEGQQRQDQFADFPQNGQQLGKIKIIRGGGSGL